MVEPGSQVLLEHFWEYPCAKKMIQTGQEGGVLNVGSYVEQSCSAVVIQSSYAALVQLFGHIVSVP